MLILEHTIKHQKFLAAVVHVVREVTGWRASDNRNGARHLATYPVQHVALNPRHGDDIQSSEPA
jgi:hypothetical protein